MSRPKGTKNKAKLAPPVFDTPVICNLLEERQWVADIKTWCAKKGFTPSELIEKFEGLEAKIDELEGYYTEEKKEVHRLLGTNGALAAKNETLQEELRVFLGQNKPDTAPQSGIFIPDSLYGPDTAPEMEKRIQDTPQFKMGRQKAENGSKRENIYAPGGAFSKLGEKTPEISPETGLPHDPSKNQERGKEGAENGAVNDWIKEAGGPFNALNTVRQQENDKKLKTKEEMPAGLSKTDMLKWHRNNK